jgi:hypothetical protein
LQNFHTDVDDLVKWDGLSVLDVLLLLAVAWRLFEGFDDERGGGRDDRDLGLTVLDGELDSDAEALPVASGLCNVFTDPGNAVLVAAHNAQAEYGLTSSATDREDRSWERVQTRHRLHRQWHEGG